MQRIGTQNVLSGIDVIDVLTESIDLIYKKLVKDEVRCTKKSYG